MAKRTRSLVLTALGTRCFIVVLGLIVGYCFPHYDRSGRFPLAQWDSIFYIDIAQHFYRFEQQFAFQPFLPFCIRILSQATMLVNVDEYYLYVVSGVLISNVCFVMATLGLYRLGQHVLHNEDVAYRSAIMFCFTPVGIFMSVVYTESLFACVSFWGLHFLAKDKFSFAAIFLAVAVATRSNGCILIGFIGFQALQKSKQASFRLQSMLLIWAKAILLISFVLLPLVLFLRYGYSMFCTDQNRPYCTDRIPNIYSFVQAQYWGLGLFKYYTVTQIPNFLLALPILLLASTSFVSFMVNGGAKHFLTAGLLESKSQPRTGGFYSSALTCYVYHAVILLVFIALIGHIQVASRLLLSSSPSLYWFIGQQSLRMPSISLLYLIWSAIFTCVGTCLFVTFLPWT